MLRGAILIFSALLVICGLILIAQPAVWPAGAELLLFGMILGAAALFESWRYQKRVDTARGTWTATGERFIDPTTNVPMEVYYNSQTGERDYRKSNASYAPPPS